MSAKDVKTVRPSKPAQIQQPKPTNTSVKPLMPNPSLPKTSVWTKPPSIISTTGSKITIKIDPVEQNVTPDTKINKTSTKDVKNHGTKVVNVKKSELVKQRYNDFEDWASSENHVYIGRDMSFYVPGTVGSIWQNPFPVAKSDKEYKSGRPRYTLDESLKLFREHIESSPDLIAKLPELKGKTLGCWCKPNRCHGDILIEMIEKYCS
ncbi:protein of unknown function DUF4326 [Yasminevirus sp. GU-2018]|uniref:DUF4326 domain-containing protein n=1 Tax=Yasminevirus sp. GU-2018 TaxID=2420051 RepID=A0A5K0U7F7_9VIRU|nr:protein of unknown function DUF4326 [Yasminevirus sp. GU-2018]